MSVERLKNGSLFLPAIETLLCMKLRDKINPVLISENKKNSHKEDEKGNIREGQEDSSISDKNHIKGNPYPGTSKSDRQYDNQEEFITPPVNHPDEEE